MVIDITVEGLESFDDRELKDIRFYDSACMAYCGDCKASFVDTCNRPAGKLHRKLKELLVLEGI